MEAHLFSNISLCIYILLIAWWELEFIAISKHGGRKLFLFDILSLSCAFLVENIHKHCYFSQRNTGMYIIKKRRWMSNDNQSERENEKIKRKEDRKNERMNERTIERIFSTNDKSKLLLYFEFFMCSSVQCHAIDCRNCGVCSTKGDALFDLFR